MGNEIFYKSNSTLGLDNRRIDEMIRERGGGQWKSNLIETQSKVSGGIDGQLGEVAGYFPKELQRETESRR